MRPLALAVALLGCASRTPHPEAQAPVEAPVAAPTNAATAPTMSEACGPVRAGAVCLPGGLSLLGAAAGEAHFEQRPPHAARLRAFVLDREEVSAGAYRACVTAGRCAALRCDVADAAPARCLAWEDARAFCASRGGRLPTEAEWQRAAAGPLEQSRAYPYGDTPAADDAAVSDFTPEGIRDLAGSVAEWVDDGGDFFAALPTYPPLDAGAVEDAAVDVPLADLPPRTDGGLVILDDPRGPARSPWRVVRGGDARLPWGQCTSALRRFRLPTDALPWVGFRCAYDAGSR